MTSLLNCTPLSRYANIAKCSWFGMDVVAKQFAKKQPFRHELEMYNALQQNGFIPGIVKLLGHEKRCLILEYIENEPLPKDTGTLQKIALNLLVSIQQMHDRGIVHKDLRFGDNVIFDGARFVIIDFDAACRKGDDVCPIKQGDKYASDMFDHVNNGEPTWYEWAFLDLLYVCDELSYLFRQTPIGTRFGNLTVNVYRRSKQITTATSKEFLDAMLNTSEMAKALFEETALTKAPIVNKLEPFPDDINQQLLQGNDKNKLWEEVQRLRVVWVKYYRNNTVLPLRSYDNASVRYLKTRLELMSGKDAREIYQGDMSDDVLLDNWNS